MKRHVLGLIAFLLGAQALLAQKADWFNPSWSYRKMVVLDHRYVLADQTGYVATIFVPKTYNIDTATGDPDLVGQIRSDCNDVWFTDISGTFLPSEIVDGTCVAMQGRFIAKVSVNVTALHDTAILMYFGNASAAAPSVTGLYDSNYQAVWYGGSNRDASGNGNNLAPVTGSLRTAPGKIGDALRFTDTVSQLASSSSVPGSNTWTWSAWIRGEQAPNKGAANYSRPLTVGSASYGLVWDATSAADFRIGSTSITVASPRRTIRGKTWGLWHVRCTSNTISVFADAALRTTGSGTCNVGAQSVLLGLGAIPFEGQIQDIEYSTTARDPYTKWVNEAYPEHFLRFGRKETAAVTVPTIDLFTESHGYLAVAPGQSVTLRWVISNSPTSVSLNQGIGAQTDLAAGSVTVTPSTTTTYTLTATNGGGSSTASVTISVLSANPIYARSGPPGATYVIGWATVGGTAQIAVGDPEPFAPGDYVDIRGSASDATSFFSNLNGTFLVAAVQDAGHFTIVNRDGSNIVPNGNRVSGSWQPFTSSAIKYTPSGAAWVGKVTPYDVVAAPRGGTLDGPSGRRTRLQTLGTQTGLTSFTVSGGIATASVSFDPRSIDIATGQQIAVWNTCNGTNCGVAFALNNGNLNTLDYVLTAVTANSFSFLVGAIPDGDYTHNDHCGPSPGNPEIIGGSDNCVRLSFFGTKSNKEFGLIATELSGQGATTPAGYKHAFDGGTGTYRLSYSNLFYVCALRAIRFEVDQTRQDDLDAVIYCSDHLERAGGVNFSVNEWLGNGNQSFADANNCHECAPNMAKSVAAAYPYLSSTKRAAAAGKLVNHRWNSATQCNKIVPQPVIVTTGTAQGGSATTIQLAASESRDMTSMYVSWSNATNIYFALIASYDSGTKTATVSTIDTWTTCQNSSSCKAHTTPATWAVPTTGTTYTIYATATLSGTTVTGYGTNFTSYHAGDGIFVAIGDLNTIYQVTPPGFPGVTAYIPTNPVSDTTMTIIAGSSQSMSATPKMLYYVPQWQTGDCSMGELMQWGMGVGSQPTQRPPGGGSQSTDADGTPQTQGSNNKPLHVRGLLDMALAAYDAMPDMAGDLFTCAQNWYWSWEQSFNWRFWAGVNNQSSDYIVGNSWGKSWFPILQYQALAGFPMPAISQHYWEDIGRFKRADGRPDLAGGQIWNVPFGGNVVTDHRPNAEPDMFAQDQLFWWFPMSNEAGKHRNWAEATMQPNGWRGGLGTTPWLYYEMDPRVPTGTQYDYTTEPLQYLFRNRDQVTCSLTMGIDCGWGRADTMISRTSWTSRTASILLVHGRAYEGGYDCPQMGATWLHNSGWLLMDDYQGTIPGSCPHPAPSTDPTTFSSAIEFNGAGITNTNSGLSLSTAGSKITKWFSENHGSWDTAYGDKDSKVSCVKLEMAESYSPTPNRVDRWVCHLKSGSEVVVQFDDVDSTNRQAVTGIRSQVHFAQNGEVERTSNGYTRDYVEGSTTCYPSTSDCQYVVEQENGAAADSKGPARNKGLLASWFSPLTITPRWDGHSYTGSRGHSERLSICANTSCGQAASALEVVYAFEVGTLPLGTPTATALNPDSSWTGTQTADKTVLFARGGLMRSTIPTFSAVAGQVLVAGVAAGTYDVNGSSYTVSEGSNMIYLDMPTSGNVTITLQGTTPPPPPSSTISGASVRGVTRGAIRR